MSTSLFTFAIVLESQKVKNYGSRRIKLQKSDQTTNIYSPLCYCLLM